MEFHPPDAPLSEQGKKKLEVAINRAKEMLQKAEKVNKGQYAHGINACSSSLRFELARIEKRPAKNWHQAIIYIDNLQARTLRIGGYLFCLQEML